MEMVLTCESRRNLWHFTCKTSMEEYEIFPTVLTNQTPFVCISILEEDNNGFLILFSSIFLFKKSNHLHWNWFEFKRWMCLTWNWIIIGCNLMVFSGFFNGFGNFVIWKLKNELIRKIWHFDEWKMAWNDIKVIFCISAFQILKLLRFIENFRKFYAIESFKQL